MADNRSAMKLRCYVCGKQLLKTFYLLSMQEESDRVFVVGAECLDRVDTDAPLTCAVTRS